MSQIKAKKSHIICLSENPDFWIESSKLYQAVEIIKSENPCRFCLDDNHQDLYRLMDSVCDFVSILVDLGVMVNYEDDIYCYTDTWQDFVNFVNQFNPENAETVTFNFKTGDNN